MRTLLRAIVVAATALGASADPPATPPVCKNHYLLSEPCDPDTVEHWKWSAAGPMTVARAFHTATPLPDGRVLVAGGITGATTDLATASAEIFDPATGEWSPTAPMSVARYLHQAVALRDGNVMVVGGIFWWTAAAGAPLAEIYETASGTWRPAAIGEFRRDPSVVLLADGRVLISGGESAALDPLSSAVLYDPAADAFQSTGAMSHARLGHYSVALADGKVLVFAGACDSYIRALISDVEVFDPAIQAWTAATDLEAPRDWATTALTAAGQVLVIGGFAYDPREEGNYRCSGSRVNESAFAPVSAYAKVDMHVSDRWETAPEMMVRRFGHTTTALRSGRLVTTGGWGSKSGWEWGWGWVPVQTASTEVFVPQRWAWTTVASLGVARAYHAAASLGDGRVLVTGGFVPGSGESLCTVCTGPWIHRTATGSTEVFGPPPAEPSP